MIQIVCKSEAYTYNVYHIVKAFFPSEETISKVEEKASHYVMVRLPDQREIVVVKEQAEISEAGSINEDGTSCGAVQTVEERRIKYWIDVRLYHELQRITGRSLAWGILTGVRPVKIAMEKAEAGWKRQGSPGRLRSGNRNCLDGWIMKQDTACMWVSPSARPCVPTVLSVPERCLTGRTGWRII